MSRHVNLGRGGTPNPSVWKRRHQPWAGKKSETPANRQTESLRISCSVAGSRRVHRPRCSHELFRWLLMREERFHFALHLLIAVASLFEKCGAVRDEEKREDVARVPGMLWEDVNDAVRYGLFSMLEPRSLETVCRTWSRRGDQIECWGCWPDSAAAIFHGQCCFQETDCEGSCPSHCL